MGAFVTVLAEGPRLYFLAGGGAAVKRQEPDGMKTISLPRNITELLDMEIIRGKTYEEKIEMLALDSFVSKLKECNEEILEFETKYGMSFGEFEKAWDEDGIRDKHSHKVESDYIEWEAIEQEKSRWLSVLRKIRRGYE